MPDRLFSRHRQTILILVVVLLAPGALLLHRVDRTQRLMPGDAISESVSVSSPATEPGSPESAADTTTETARQHVHDLELALGAAVEERKIAEALLEQSEQDVEDLERFIEEIEARGEDPADFAEQGLEMFQPAFYAYQEVSARLEQAQASEAALRAELESAEQRLRTLESRD